MWEPAELLLIQDQYHQAYRSLSRGLAAEDSGDRAKALEAYRKGRQHLVQGAEVPLRGGRPEGGAAWDAARTLQRRMRDALPTVDTHLSGLETSSVGTGSPGGLLKSLPPLLPPQRPLYHLYPPIRPPAAAAAAAHNSPLPSRVPPPRPPSPAAPQLPPVPAAAPDMADPGQQPPAYTPQPTSGHLSLAFHGPGSGRETGPGEGLVLLHVPSGVQMFFVAPDGQVSSLSCPGYLRIITFENPDKDSTAGRPWTFLQVSST